MKLGLCCSFLFLLPALATSFAQSTTPSTKDGNNQGSVTTRGDSRSLDETFLWVKKEMEFSGSSHDIFYPEQGYKWHRVTDYSNLELHDCSLTIDKTAQSNDIQRKARYTIVLGDLSSAAYQLDEGSKQFKYTPAVPALFLRSRTKSMHWERPRSYVATDLVEIEFGRDPGFGKDKIDRLAGALLHLRELCASQTPRPSENK